MVENEEKKNKLNDIRNIEFEGEVQEILTSMETILTLFEIDDDEDVIRACKIKLEQGVKVLRRIGADQMIKRFNKH